MSGGTNISMQEVGEVLKSIKIEIKMKYKSNTKKNSDMSYSETKKLRTNKC
jgi:hypothetical protein